MKKMNNKGFSLVELIIVIAIMAILIAVLAPQYIKYVEKSRQSADLDNWQAIVNAIQVAYADVENPVVGQTSVKANGKSATLTADSSLVSAFASLGVDPAKITMKSTAYSSASIVAVETSGVVTLSCSDPSLKAALGLK